jgi:hypothetical protein
MKNRRNCCCAGGSKRADAGSRARAHRVLGGADGPVRLDAHVTLDGDGLRSRARVRGSRASVIARRRGVSGAAHPAGSREQTRWENDAFPRTPPRASEAGARTFLAAKDFFAPANWGRTAVEEAMACIVDDSCVVEGRGRVRICPAAREREASFTPAIDVSLPEPRIARSSRTPISARRVRREAAEEAKRAHCLPTSRKCNPRSRNQTPGEGSRASRVGFFSRLLVSATVITDS